MHCIVTKSALVADTCLLNANLQVHTKNGPTISASKVVMATYMPLVANLAVVSRQVRGVCVNHRVQMHCD